MTITPGYDFTVNEVPTRLKLETMTAGMSITGIDISQIAATLIGIKKGDTSTSLPSEGWLLHDPPGGLWVLTRHGRVHLWRGGWGGLECNRFPCSGNPVTGTYPYKVGEGGQVFLSATNHTNESNIAWRLNQRSDNNSSFAPMKPLETLTTSANPRIALWGGVPWPVESTFHNKPGHVIIAAVAASGLAGAQSIPFSNGSARTLYGSLHYNWSATSGTMRTGLVWSYGIGMREM